MLKIISKIELTEIGTRKLDAWLEIAAKHGVKRSSIECELFSAVMKHDAPMSGAVFEVGHQYTGFAEILPLRIESGDLFLEEAEAEG